MPKKTVFIVVLVVLFLALVTGSYLTYRWWQNKKNLERETEEMLENEDTKEDAEANSDNETEESQIESKTATTNEGWSLYKNYQNSFLIEYPTDAQVEDISDPVASDIHYSECVKISTDNYYVLVGTAPTEDDPVMCFRSGVGADWSQGPTETVTAAGMEYTTTGMHTEAASAGYYQDFFMISPVDGRVNIEYGIDVNEKYGTISKVDAKDIVHKIIASYSPAE